MSEQSTPPGWYPTGDGRDGYWDGHQWTEFRAPQDKTPGALKARAAGAAARLTSKDSPLPAGALWSAVGKPLTGIGGGRYWLDQQYLYFERGTLKTDSQQVPIEQVLDVDVKQTMAQKARGVFTVLVRVQRGTGQLEVVTMDDIPDGREAQRIINETAHDTRQRLQRAYNTTIHEGSMPVTQPTPQMQPEASTHSTPDPIEQLAQLGKLHEAGVLTDEEFSSKKAEILSRM